MIPGLGGSQRLPRLIGPSRAKDLILATWARTRRCRSGWRSVADEAVYDEALALARRSNRWPWPRAVNQGLEVDIATGCQIERLEFSGLFATDDRRIGMESFLADARKVMFTGH